MPKRFPVSIRLFSTGREVARFWVAFGDEWIDYAEGVAARMANEWGQETDIFTGGVFPSGKVAGWDRIGIRCLPA